MIVETSDRDVAAEALRRNFPGLDLAPSDDHGSFRFFHSREQRGFVTYSQVQVAGRLRTDGFYPDEFSIGRRLGGRVALAYGADEIDTTGVYLRPQGDSSIRFEDSQVELITLDPTRLRVLADRYLEGSGGRLLAPTAALGRPSAPGARLWAAVAEAIAADDGSSPLVASALQDLIVVTFLVAFPVVEGGAATAGVRVLPRVLRRASDYIDENLAEPISVTQIAEAARISVRTLQYGFRNHFGDSPHSYVRERRLRQIHAELRRSDPASTTVVAVARRWGIGHSGRFTADYHARFGEYPSDTLRR